MLELVIDRHEIAALTSDAQAHNTKHHVEPGASFLGDFRRCIDSRGQLAVGFIGRSPLEQVLGSQQHQRRIALRQGGGKSA